MCIVRDIVCRISSAKEAIKCRSWGVTIYKYIHTYVCMSKTEKPQNLHGLMLACLEL